MDFNKIFADNREYISRRELDPAKINAQFVRTDTRSFLTIGTVDLPSGRIRLGDPFAYLCAEQYAPILEKTVTPGSYPVEISVVRSAFDSVRICTSRLKLKPTAAVRYEIATSTHETCVFKASDGDMPGFPVDAGMMCFTDAEVAHEFRVWLDAWHEKNPDANHYDDYFAALFAESYERIPVYQREGGDFIEWAVPDTGSRLVMNASGYGDGLYLPFWGFDSEGEVCELTVPLVDADESDRHHAEYLAVWDGIEPCIVTKHISEGGGIAYMCRYETTAQDRYNGWIFYGFDEDQKYWDDANNFDMFSTHALAERFPGIIPLLHSPTGSAFFTDKDGNFIPDNND